MGEAKNSWLTGTSAWNYVAISQAILGILPDYDGLRIDPCIPADWDEYTVPCSKRRYIHNVRWKWDFPACIILKRIMNETCESGRKSTAKNAIPHSAILLV